MFTIGMILGMTLSGYGNILINVASKKKEEERALQKELESKFFNNLAKGCVVYRCNDDDNGKSAAFFRASHGLTFSYIPDFVISKKGRILVEVKRLTWVDPSREAFSGKGAEQLLGMCSKSAIEAIYKWCDGFQKDESKKDHSIPLTTTLTVVPHWYERKKDSITDPAYDAGIMFTFTFKDGKKVKPFTLYQLDSYVLD